MLLILGLGLFVWKNGFGLLATERQVEWRFPIAYANIRSVDLQLWLGESLIKREERTFERGVSETIEYSVPMTRGVHRAIAVVRTRDGASRTFRTELDPQSNPRVVVEFAFVRHDHPIISPENAIY